MAADLGVEIEFADGTFVVDRVYAGPLREATHGETDRFTFREAMKLVGPILGRGYVRAAFEGMVRDHLGRYG